MSRHRRQTLLGRLAPGLLLAVLLASACTEPTSPDRHASGAAQMATTAGDTVRITGSGTLGPGPQAPGNSYQEVNVDVASTLSGSFLFRDWSVVRPDGSAGQITVSPTDTATHITAFRDGSTTCPDPADGVEFDGIGRVNTQGNSDPSGDQFLSFSAVACDDGPAGSNLDLFALSVPGHGYNFGPDRLTSGDLAKVTGGAPPPPPPPDSGDLAIATSTTGSKLDPDGYTLTIDGGSSRAIGINASTTFTGLASGSHTVALSGVAGNCTVDGGASRTVDVSAGGTASVSYAVTCAAANQPPVVDAGPNQTALTGLLYSLSWSFSDPDNGPWSYTIDWGDGSTTSGSKSSAGSFTNGHTYVTVLPRNFTVTVTVTDSQGASGSDSKVVSVLLL